MINEIAEHIDTIADNAVVTLSGKELKQMIEEAEVYSQSFTREANKVQKLEADNNALREELLVTNRYLQAFIKDFNKDKVNMTGEEAKAEVLAKLNQVDLSAERVEIDQHIKLEDLLKGKFV
jgi:hypothetical protein